LKRDSWPSVRLGNICVSAVTNDFNRDVVLSPLNRRGWVLQEHALARRTIFFTENQMYWECGDGVRCETLGKLMQFVSPTNDPFHSANSISATKLPCLVIQTFQAEPLKGSTLGVNRFISGPLYSSNIRRSSFHTRKIDLLQSKASWIVLLLLSRHEASLDFLRASGDAAYYGNVLRMAYHSTGSFRMSTL
jgi:hypothetical protein